MYIFGHLVYRTFGRQFCRLYGLKFLSPKWLVTKRPCPFATRTESQVAENPVFWSSRHRGKHSRNRGGSANAPYDKYKRPIKGKNPADQHGNTTTYKVGGSINHWARNCPDNRDINGNQEPGTSTSEANVYLTFADVTVVLLKESFGCCIIDTACTATVAGEEWMTNFIEKLTSDQKK